MEKKLKFDRKTLFACAEIAVIAVMGCCIWQQSRQISSMQEKLRTQNENLNKLNVIYTFNLEDLVLSYPKLIEDKKAFDNKILELSKEVDEAQKKIKKFKNSKVKEDFAEMYLKSLQTKRDDLINSYQKSMQDTNTAINETLVKIAKERNAVVVFDTKSITVSTPNVVNLTDDVVKRLTEK